MTDFQTYSMASFLGGESKIPTSPTSPTSPVKSKATEPESKGSMIVPFVVDNVENKATKLEPVNALNATRLRINNEVVEATGFGDNPIVSLRKQHGFIAAVGMAFDKHYPLSLAPSHFWLLIAQGVAKHIELNAERLRDTFVSHQGREKIEIRRDEFVKGSPDNDWPGAFDEFSSCIQKLVKPGPYVSDIVNTYSTTSAVEKACLEITLMDAMKDYFEYSCRTCCGFPKIYMEGTVQDWEELHARVQRLRKLDPQDQHFTGWTNSLSEITQKLVDSAHGKPDLEHWRSFFKLGGGSGGPFINGWINTFFPYLSDRPYNASVNWKDNSGWGGGGANIDDMPAGLSAAPFIWHYYKTDYRMKFVGGFLGVEQVKDTLAVRPGVGWAVTDLGQKSPAILQKELNERAIAFNKPRLEDIRMYLSDEIRRLAWGSPDRKRFEQVIKDGKERFLVTQFSPWDHGRNILTEKDLERPDGDEEAYQAWLASTTAEIQQALQKNSN